MSVGYGEQILLTETGTRPGDTAPRWLCGPGSRPHRLRDLLEPELISSSAVPACAVDFPALKSLRCAAQQSSRPAHAAHRTGERGRYSARALIDSRTRLVTLSGAGGTGKTRLALQAAAEVLDQISGTASGGSSAGGGGRPDLALPTIAATLWGAGDARSPLRTTCRLTSRSGRRSCSLTISNSWSTPPRSFVNCWTPPPVGAPRHQPRAAAAACGARVPDCSPPAAGGACERSRRTRRWAVPGGTAVLSRAQRSGPDLSSMTGNVATWSPFAATLDGLPLAIELAAARARLLPPAALLARLDGRLAILTGGAPRSPRTATDAAGGDSAGATIAGSRGTRALRALLRFFPAGLPWMRRKRSATWLAGCRSTYWTGWIRWSREVCCARKTGPGVTRAL